MTLRILASLSLLTAAFLAGCDPVMAPHPGRPDLLQPTDYPTIVATSDLHKWLAFTQPNVQGPPEGKPMSVSTGVRVLADVAVNTQYRYRFFDGTGREIQPVMTWRYQRLPARVVEFLNGSALDTNAVSFLLEVRTAR